MVAQVDEQQPAMVARAVDPAGQAHAAADIGSAQFAAIMSAVGVHGVSFTGPAFVESGRREVKALEFGPPAGW